jgi:hypothetical protein
MAEQAVSEARQALAAKPAQRIGDSMAQRISAVLGFVSAEQVAIYQPLALPAALQLGGFLMLAWGFAPRVELSQPRRKKGNRKPRKAKQPNKALGTATVVNFPSAGNHAAK